MQVLQQVDTKHWQAASKFHLCKQIKDIGLIIVITTSLTPNKTKLKMKYSKRKIYMYCPQFIFVIQSHMSIVPKNYQDLLSFEFHFSLRDVSPFIANHISSHQVLI